MLPESFPGKIIAARRLLGVQSAVGSRGRKAWPPNRSEFHFGPEPFFAVGTWYADFTQTTDEEVQRLLAV